MNCGHNHNLEKIFQYQTIDVTIEIENPEILEYLSEIVVSVQQKYRLFNYKLSDGTLSVDYENGVLYFELSEVDTSLMQEGETISIMINAVTNTGKHMCSDGKYEVASVDGNIYKVLMV